MGTKLLKKGLEIELYAGTERGEVLPLSTKLKEHFPDFSQEPDQRNFEYITNPNCNYNNLFKEIIERRLKVRDFLKKSGNLTLIPGSTIPLEYSKDFFYSKPGDPYSELILKSYGTSVITTSIHINIGIENYDDLFKLLSILRLYTPLFLALSASSCFHDGKVTGYNSFRWHSFPKTPSFVPFFLNHDSYVSWIKKEIEEKKMFNVRHLWTSIRPNGPDRPNDLNRIEIRICDLIFDVKKLLSVVALIECIAQNYLTNKESPPILTTNLDSLVNTIMEEEENVAKFGLKAQTIDFESGNKNSVYKIIESLYNKHKKIAEELNILEYLNPILDILKDGNESEQFLTMYNKNGSIQKTIEHFIQHFTSLDLSLCNIIE